MASHAGIKCSKCLGDLQIALPPQANREMIYRCKNCGRLLLIDDTSMDEIIVVSSPQMMAISI